MSLPPPRRLGGGAPRPVGWLRRLTGYCLRHRRDLFAAFGAAAGGAVVSAIVPLVIRHVVDTVMRDPQQSVGAWVGMLIGAAALQYAITFVRRYSAGRLSLDVQYDMRADVFAALSRLDGAAQDSLETGQVVSRAITDVGLVQGLLAFVPLLSSNALLFVVSLVVMVALSPMLTLVALAVVPALWFVANASRRDLFPANWDAQQQSGELIVEVEAAITGVRVVKGFGQEEREVGELEQRARRLFASRMRVVRLQAKYSPALQAIPTLGQVGVLLLGGWLALNGHLTLGTFLAFSTYLGQLVGPVRQLTSLLTIGQQARAGVERVLDIVDATPAITDPPAPAPIPDGPVALELDHVRFGYSRAHPVLDDVSLRVEPGETLAVVGGSGSGKSTIALLAPRFYDVQAGAVRVGGVDVRDAALADLRSRMGVVFEDSFLFSDTIAANIAFGRPDASAEQIRAAARAAEADRFIAELPDGYETVVGERGMTLSGGQRQRIALARALLIDPWLLLLDDATSAVDSRVEAEINATLRRVMRGRTTLLIAHRRSSLELADRIAVLDAGRVVDVGGYAELMARSAQFRRLLAGSGDDAEGAGASSPLGGLGADHRPDPGTGAESAGASSPLAGLGANHRPDPGTGAKGTGAKGTGACGPPAAEAADATGVTASAWPPDAPREPAHGSFGRTAATPALLARVAALPPAQDEPDVADAIARAPDPSFGLRRLLRPVRAVLTVGLVLVGVDAVAQLVVPALIRTGIDRGVTGRSLRILVALSLIALIVLLADWAIQHTGLRVTGRTGERLLYTLRVKTFAHLQRLGLDYYERELAGRIITRMTTDVDALSNFLQTGLATMLVSLLTLFGVLVALILLDAGLSLVLVAILPVLVAATWLFRHVSVPNYQLARDRISLVNAQFQENVAGVRVTQAMGREGHNAEQFARSAMAYRNTRMRSQIYISVYFPFVQFLADLAAALVLAIGATRLRDGTLTAGSLIAYFLYLDSFFSPVQQLSQVFDGYQQSAVGLSRLRELLRTPTTTPPPAAPVDPGRRLRGEIDLRAIRFAYSGAASEAIAGLDLRVAPGETIALVGETGAGKSTVVKLIARFYDPTSGGVLVDGRDLRRFDLPAYRHRLGVVPQEAYLSPGTVRDAIAYGQPDASDAQVEAAARSVSAHDMIAGLPLGYLRQVGERGRNLSAGQRQLVALARAALVDPDILLLDEATASLDLASELAVTRATEALSRRRTTVVVAHRLSTAARADRIIVMDRGRIVEAGPHAELFAAGGAYRALWDAYTGAQQSA